MELKQLKQFVTIAHTLNFRRAADALNISQPPLSVSIRKLEEELGAPLFERGTRRVSLTPLGEAVLSQARDVLSAADALIETARSVIDGSLGRLSVNFVASATYALLPAVVPRFRKIAPRVQLTLKEATTLEIIERLKTGEIDIGVIRTPAYDLGDLLIAPLYEEELVLAVPQDHHLAERPYVALEELAEEDFVVYDRNGLPFLWNLILAACRSAGFTPRFAEEAAHVHTLIALVESGIGVALVPQVMQRSGSGRVRYVKLNTGSDRLTVGLACASRRAPVRPIVRTFSEILGVVAQEIDTVELSKAHESILALPS